MSHTVHPYAHRLGYLRLKSAGLVRAVHIKNLADVHSLVAIIYPYINLMDRELILSKLRPGMLIGRSGEGSTKLRADILKFMTRIGAEIPKDFKNGH